MPDDAFRDAGAYGATFVFTVDGQQIGRFTEVSGLEVSIDVEEYKEGGVNGYVHKFPGRMSWPNLVFKRGITQTDALFDWINECSGEGLTRSRNRVARHTGAVTLVSSKGEPVRHWSFEGAFPVRWSGPKFASSSSEYPEEELEISHRGLRAETTG